VEVLGGMPVMVVLVVVMVMAFMQLLEPVEPVVVVVEIRAVALAVLGETFISMDKVLTGLGLARGERVEVVLAKRAEVHHM